MNELDNTVGYIPKKGDIVRIKYVDGKTIIALCESIDTEYKFISNIESGVDLSKSKLSDISLATSDEIRDFMSDLIDGNKILHCGFDNVEKPEYYAKDKIECIDAMESAFGIDDVISFCRCNSFKYQWRSKNKNGLEDIKKSIWYQNKIIELSKKKK